MKKNFSSIFSVLTTLDKIGTIALDEARLAFNELPESDQATEKVNLETLEAKHDETADKTASDEAEAATKATAEAEAAAKALEAEGQVIQASEVVDSAVFKETGLTMTQIKDMQRKFSELEKAQKFAETEKTISGFVFSESNKTGIVLPKAAQKFSEFASKLPDAMAKEFFELLGSKSFRVIELGEIGTQGGNDGLEFNVPQETPANTTRESFVLDHVAKAFQEKDKSLSYEKAMVSALKHIETNGIK